MSIKEKLTAVADAIRAKTNSTGKLTLDAMPTAIASIESGGGGGGTINSYISLSAPTADVGSNGDLYVQGEALADSSCFPTDLVVDSVTDYEGNTTGSITLEAGLYKVECWGAQGTDIVGEIPEDNAGGNPACTVAKHGGKGGYASAFINPTTKTTYAYVVGGRRDDIVVDCTTSTQLQATTTTSQDGYKYAAPVGASYGNGLRCSYSNVVTDCSPAGGGTVLYKDSVSAGRQLVGGGGGGGTAFSYQTKSQSTYLGDSTTNFDDNHTDNSANLGANKIFDTAENFITNIDVSYTKAFINKHLMNEYTATQQSTSVRVYYYSSATATSKTSSTQMQLVAPTLTTTPAISSMTANRNPSTNYKFAGGGSGGGFLHGIYCTASDDKHYIFRWCGHGGLSGAFTNKLYTLYKDNNDTTCKLTANDVVLGYEAYRANEEFPAVDGGMETGHSGVGHMRITKYSSYTLDLSKGMAFSVNKIYIKSNGTWTDITYTDINA